MKMKLTFFVLLCFSMSSVLGLKWCRYDCESEYSNSYGNGNFGNPSFYQPYHRTTGFSPLISKSLCDSPTELSESNYPVAILSAPTPTFAVLCSDGLSLFEVTDGDITLLSKTPVVELGNGYVTTGFRQVVLSSNNKVTAFDLVEGELVEKASVQDTSLVSAAGFATSSSMFAFFDGSMKEVNFETGEVTEHSNLPANKLFYSVVDGSNNVYYCNADEIVQVKPTGEVNTLATASFGFSCTSLLASRANTLVVSGSVGPSASSLVEVNTKSFDSVSFIGNYPFQITGVSREAWREGATKYIAYLAVLSEKGVFVIVERHPTQPRGAVYSHFTSTGALAGRPTLSSLANPVVFDTDNVISYTNDFLVKFFDTKFGDNLDDFEFYDFLPNPLVFNKALIAFTTSGEAVLYGKCTRYAVGDEVPDNACPIPEIPTVETDTYWITIFSGVAAGLSVPFIGEALCNKMKYFGKEEDDDVEVELYSEAEESDEEEEEYLTPHPIKTREI